MYVVSFESQLSEGVSQEKTSLQDHLFLSYKVDKEHCCLKETALKSTSSGKLSPHLTSFIVIRRQQQRVRIVSRGLLRCSS
jgi:hypothetical protein